MVKTYRTIQQWDHWLTHSLGHSLLEAEKIFLSKALAECYGKQVLLIGVPHQQDLLKCSVMSHQVLLTPLVIKQKNNKCIESEYYNLPIVPGSIDLVIIPHTLEFLDNPRQLLAEACRIIKPQGLMVLFGFNPMSLWGLKKWWAKSKKVPWSGSFTPANKIKSWLKLADFEIIRQDMLLFRPPIFHPTIYQKLRFLEWMGSKISAPWGGVYAITAQAKVIPLTPIKLHWKQKLSVIQSTLPKPTMRDIQQTEVCNEKRNDIY